jgi:hypothetical protein
MYYSLMGKMRLPIGHMTQMFSAKLEITTILKGLMKIFYYNKILL